MTPKRIFIIPYRDREAHKGIFISHMTELFKNDEYEIAFVHQQDKRIFNRGAMKNIGFIYYKKKFPDDWKNITFIFHDIDGLPYKKLFDYNTTKGTITHFYGFKFCLGGIFAIKGEDYEKIKGFPNYWGWGFEDNKLKKKWDSINGKMNYSQFLHFTDKRVVKLDSSNKEHELRNINYNNLKYAQLEAMGTSGYNTIRNLEYKIQEESSKIIMINVTSFLTERKEKNQKIIKNVTGNMISKDNRKRMNKRQPQRGAPMKMFLNM